MPIGPFSAGILPGGTGFAPVPAPPVPTPAMSGLAVNSNGSLVSMLPPVTDWFSPVAQSPAVQTPAAHPCQSGGDCGCGGTCGGASKTTVRTSSSTLPTNSTSRTTGSKLIPRNIPSLSSFSPVTSLADFDFKRDVLSRAPGCGIVLSSHNQFGVVANNCEVAVQPDGSMTMAIASAAKGTNISVTLKPLGNEQWEIGNGISTRTAYIPDIMPLEVLATIGWASYVGNQMFADKMLSKSSNYNASSGTTVEQIFSNPVILSNPTSNPPQTLCITHDLVCSNISFLGLNLISFTQNQTSVQQQVPCLGEINVNVEDCCKQHDVSIWCSQTENDLAAANLAVIACITAKVIAARQEAFWSIKWTWGTFLCKLTNSVVELFSDIVDVAGGVLLEILTALADLVGEALATVLGLLSLGQVPQSLLQSILGTSEAILSPDLWDYDGSHAQSCLCRGTVPTTQCSEQSLECQWEPS